MARFRSRTRNTAGIKIPNREEESSLAPGKHSWPFEHQPASEWSKTPMATRLHARESIGAPCYIRLLSIIPYYPNLAAAISSFVRNTLDACEPLVSLFSLSLSPFLHDHASFARSWPTPINFTKFRSIRITRIDGAINYERRIILRSECVYNVFFCGIFARFTRTIESVGCNQQITHDPSSSLISILSVRLAYCLFAKLRCSRHRVSNAHVDRIE